MEQNLPVKNIQTIRNLLDNLSLKSKLRLFASKTKEGEVGSMAAFATDQKRAYYVFGANSSHMRDAHTGTMVLWDGFELLRLSGVSEIDLEGINSPRRGYFKLSFGGDIVPYYHLKLK